MVDYIKKSCLGWTDYYEDAEAEARHELLSFDAGNIVRIGVAKMNKVITAFNVHYGLMEADQGEAKGSNLPEPSHSVTVAASSQKSTLSSAPTE